MYWNALVLRLLLFLLFALFAFTLFVALLFALLGRLQIQTAVSLFTPMPASNLLVFVKG